MKMNWREQFIENLTRPKAQIHFEPCHLLHYFWPIFNKHVKIANGILNSLFHLERGKRRKDELPIWNVRASK